MFWHRPNHLQELLDAANREIDAVRTRADEIVSRLTALEEKNRKPTLFCSFCSKSQHDVKTLIAGPEHSFICDDCVRLCMDIVINPGKQK